MSKFIWPEHSGVFAVFVSIVFVLFTALPASAFAQDDEEEDHLTILITASRFAETVDETLAPVTLITREDIERTQAVTVEEVLRTVPGVTLANSGGVGKLTSLFLRGTESDHILVLIDGVKVGSATSGLTPFQHLPLDQIEKIEVVRGPRSSLYGSEAIGGVIQIFMRKDGKARSASVGGGSHNTKKWHVAAGNSNEDAWINIGASYFSTNGFTACRGSTNPFAGCFVAEDAPERDHDGNRQKSYSLRGGVALTDVFLVEGNLLNTDGKTEFDSSDFPATLLEDETNTTTRVASVKATLRQNEHAEVSFAISRSKDKSRNFKECDANVPAPTTYDVNAFNQAPPVYDLTASPCTPNVEWDETTGAVDSFDRVLGNLKVSEFNTKRNRFEFQASNRFSENGRLIVGVDHLDDKVDGSTAYAVRSRDNIGVFASLRNAVGDNDFEASLRRDNNEQFGSHTTGSVAWGRAFGEKNRATLSYGTAFKAPNFNELYNSSEFCPGNPELSPEKSESIDLGFSHANKSGIFTVNFYQTKIDDLISICPIENIAGAEITGAELAADFTAGKWDVRTSLTLQNPEDDSGDANYGNLLPRRSKRIVQLDADRNFGRYAVGASLHARGDGYDDPANTRKLHGFTVVDLRGEMRIQRNWSLGLKVNNLFDEEYETVSFFPQAGINFLTTLRYIPDR